MKGNGTGGGGDKGRRGGEGGDGWSMKERDRIEASVGMDWLGHGGSGSWLSDLEGEGSKYELLPVECPLESDGDREVVRNAYEVMLEFFHRLTSFCSTFTSSFHISPFAFALARSFSINF
jgi:hypothetical protein